MKPGDWVVPLIDYVHLLKSDSDIYFTNFTPNPNTICTVAGLRRLVPTMSDMDVLDVEETQMCTTIPGKVVGFDPDYWRVIEKPELDIEQLLEETELVLIEL